MRARPEPAALRNGRIEIRSGPRLRVDDRLSERVDTGEPVSEVVLLDIGRRAPPAPSSDLRLMPVVRSGTAGGEVEDVLRPARATGPAWSHVVRLLKIAGMMR